MLHVRLCLTNSSYARKNIYVVYKGYILEAHEIAETLRPLLGDCATKLRPDVLQAIKDAREQESYEPAQRILNQFIENARIAEEEDVAICQDTGTVWILVELDQNVHIIGDLQKELDKIVGEVWEDKGLRASLVKDALFDRANTKDNTPVFVDVVAMEDESSQPGARISVMLKGAGSDNISRVIMLSPAEGVDAIEKELVDLINEKASIGCPPLVIGVGIGSTFDKVARLAKKSLLRDISKTHPDEDIAALEERLLRAVNATGRGPAGLGGDTTALRVLVDTAPAHIAALPVALNIGCSALRSRTVFIPGTKVH